MILIDNQPIYFPNSSSQSQFIRGREILDILLENPTLLSASNQFKSESERTVSDSGAHMKHVYVFQREFATVNPTLVQIVGTDEATTCVCLVIRNRNNGLTSVSHMDFPGVVDKGLDQMVQSINDPEAILDVHLVGCYDDSPNKVETTTGQVLPACFENHARCPDEIVRRILVSVSSDDSNLRGKLLDIYDTRRDIFTIPCVPWSLFWSELAFSQGQLSDEEFLLQCSTSPFAEPPHFVQCQRRIGRYLIEHPDWRYTFPGGKPHVFQRKNDGTWLKCD